MTIQIQKPINDFAVESITQTSRAETLEIRQPSGFELIDEEFLKNISHVKRFKERLQADPNFREQVSANPHKAVVDYGFKVNLEETKPLWNTELKEKLGDKVPLSPFLNLYKEFQEKIISSCKLVSPDSLKEPHFKVWRERQIARAASQFKQSIHNEICHFPASFELSKGCSIGCHFCGVSAPRLNDIFFYTPDNAKLWREVLEVMKEIVGEAVGTGFCYWATDPLDNPDYEKFCSDFHAVMGKFPPTTTAQPLKNPDRTRALLKLSMEKGCLLNRFSILSLKMLDQVYAEFSAEELAFVNLALQNKESDTIKANAGRTRERNISKGQKDSEFPDQGTIACVSGFLFNMVERSVKLISPCNANERWPLGYIVYDEGTFSDNNDLKVLIERMIIDNMPLTVQPNKVMNFRRDLTYENLDDGFQVSTKFKTFRFRHEPYLRELGNAIHQGDKTAEQIASMFEQYGISSAYTFHNFNLMFEKGVLDEEPQRQISKVLVQK